VINNVIIIIMNYDIIYYDIIMTDPHFRCMVMLGNMADITQFTVSLLCRKVM